MNGRRFQRESRLKAGRLARYNPAMKRMYWTHPDVFEVEVEVAAAGPDQVTTDPIIFHPDEGGQPADRGAIGEAAVYKVEVIDGQVIHTLDRPLPDGKYLARLDREHRLYTATQHTAQHVLSGIAAGQLGLETVGVHIGLESCTVDFDKKVEWDVAEDLERRVMAVVSGDIPVETVFDEDMQARSRLGRIEADVIRVVKIGDIDRSACCGAHVRTTGQIGVIRIFDLESRKQGTRVSFLAGRRALEQSQSETFILRELRKIACCANAELPAALQKALERSKESTKEVERLWSARLGDLVKSAEIVAVGSSNVGLHVGALPRELVPVLAGMMAEATGGAGVVVSDVQIAVSAKTLDAGGLLREIQSRIGGKGGGSPKAAQGRLDRPVTAGELVTILTSLRQG
jgi:alanyl-tRNA synthetase